jgi:hypothetical protein
MRQLYAKYPGTCSTCGEQFPAGTFINFYGRGRAAHFCCPRNLPENQIAECWECKDPNGKLRNYGAATPVYCDACEARIRPATFHARLFNDKCSSYEDQPCGNTAYEDACRDACGL